MSVSVGAWRFAPYVEAFVLALGAEAVRCGVDADWEDEGEALEASAVGRPTCVRTFETSLRRLEIEHGVRQVG